MNPNPRSTPGRSDGGHGGLSGSLRSRVGGMYGVRDTLLVRPGRGNLWCGQPVLRLLRDRLGRGLHNGCLDGRADLHSPLRELGNSRVTLICSLAAARSVLVNLPPWWNVSASRLIESVRCWCASQRWEPVFGALFSTDASC